MLYNLYILHNVKLKNSKLKLQDVISEERALHDTKYHKLKMLGVLSFD